MGAAQRPTGQLPTTIFALEQKLLVLLQQQAHICDAAIAVMRQQGTALVG